MGASVSRLLYLHGVSGALTMNGLGSNALRGRRSLSLWRSMTILTKSPETIVLWLPGEGLAERGQTFGLSSTPPARTLGLWRGV